MKKITVFSTLFSTLIMFNGCSNNTQSPSSDISKVSLKTSMDSVSYIIGTDIAKSLVAFKDDINLLALRKGLNDNLFDKDILITKDQAEPIMKNFSMKLQEKQKIKNETLKVENMEKGKKFLEENKSKEGVITTESGLQYIVIKEGTGPKVTGVDLVSVNYEGTLLDGKIFDSSIKRGEPASMRVTQVIKGWSEALLLMNVGSKFKLFIPSELGYGENGAPRGGIGPNEVLTFELEVLSTKK